VRAVVQRVSRASVTVEGEAAGDAESEAADELAGEMARAIGAGLVALVGVTHTDGPGQARKLAERIWHLRVMDDEQGVMNRSVADTTGAVLVVSQFTLYGDTSKGRRPSWLAAARPEQAEPLVQEVVDELRRLGATVATGRFRTEMAVELVNDGPVTVLLEV
jgi:D-tyrosyl-tRNA(Tyr) deacylase